MSTRLVSTRRGVRALVVLAIVSSLAVIVLLNSSRESKSRPPPLILYWSRVFGSPPLLDDFCPLESSCTITADRQVYDHADAVVAHAADISAAAMPNTTANERQRWVLASQEAPPSLERLQGSWWHQGVDIRSTFSTSRLQMLVSIGS